MTDTETEVQTPGSVSPLPIWQRALAVGTGFGIAVGPRDLNVAIARARPSGPALLAQMTVSDFRAHPAAQWGSGVLKLLADAGESRLAATVLLPREEVIVRTLVLPGVADKDAASAIELQVDALHPWTSSGRDEGVAWGWSRAGSDSVLVGLVRKEALDSYQTLFSEAGIPLAAISFSAAVVYSALRIWNAAPASLLCFNAEGEGSVEVYGESEGRAVYSAEFPASAERALALSRGALRLAPEHAATALADALPQPLRGGAPGSALAWSAALAGSAARGGRFANLLPAGQRESHNRVQYLVPLMLGILLVCAAVAAFLILPAIEQRRYRQDLDREARSLEPAALQAQSLAKAIASDRSKIAALDQFRGRPQADLDVLNELTRLLPTQTWTNIIEIYPDSVVISGEAEQAAPLLKILDSSPLFQNSEFSSSVAHNKDSEQFRIRTMRRGRTGKTTP